MDYEKILLEWKSFEIPEVFKRDYRLDLNYDLVTTITGPRRSGKTYFCFQLIKKLLEGDVPKENLVYINFEDERLIGANANDLNEIFDKYLEICEPILDKTIYLFFDEIQNVLNWTNWVRRIYDTKKNVKVILTGSSSKLLSREIATNLRGRIYNLEILPFSFKEFLRLDKIAFGNRVEVHNNLIKIKKLFKRYLVEGGYPFVSINRDVPRNDILQEYYNSMIFRDVIERYKISDVKKLQILANFIFESNSKDVSYSKLSNKMNSLGFSLTRNTVGEYVSYFEEAYLFFQVMRYEYSIQKRLGAIKKVYTIDNGLLNAVSFKFSKDYGKLLENLVFLELYRRKKKVFYNRDKFECDFLIQEKNKIVNCIQVCYELNDENKDREIKGLMEAMNKFKINAGLILTNDNEDEIWVDKKKIIVKPVWKWLLEG